MILSAVLASLTAAGNYHLFQWASSQLCNQPPDTVYVYKVSHAKKWRKAANETWPPLMDYWAPFYPFNSCGSVKVPFDGLCCTSVQEPAVLYGVASATTSEFDTLPVDQSRFPSFMKESKYCVLIGALNYTELYVGTAGACTERALKCTSNGTLQVFGRNSDCTGASQAYPLAATVSLQNDPLLGQFNAEFRIINNGSVPIGWTEELVTSTRPITNLRPLEILETFCYVTILLIELALITYFSLRFIRSKAKPMLLHVVCHVFWLVYVCLSIQYTYIQFSLDNTGGTGAAYRADTLTARSFFIGLSSLMTAITTTHFIVVFWKLRRNYTIALYVAMFVVHMGLIGGRYMYAGMPRSDQDYDANAVFVDNLTFWTNKISFSWFIVLFIYDLLPIVYLIGHSLTSMGNETSSWQKIKDHVRVDILSTVLFLSQALIVTGYFVNENIRAYTPILGSDRNHQATAAYSIWFIALHSAFNTIVTYRIAHNIKSGSYFLGSTAAKSGKMSKLATSEVSQAVSRHPVTDM